MAKATDDESLKRLGGGRWQTRDERFTIEPQSGTWVVVDADATDDLGLPLVRGPFGSLTAAKAGITSARTSGPATSPLPDRAAKLRDRPTRATERAATGPKSAKPGKPATAAKRSTSPVKPKEPAEPSWVAALDTGDRRRARQVIDHLTKAGAPDPEGIVRRDLVGGVAAVAAFAVERALAELGDDPTAERVAALLAEGRDDDLGVRWRLVDDQGRPITLDGR